MPPTQHTASKPVTGLVIVTKRRTLQCFEDIVIPKLMDFFVRHKDSLVPVEVKSKNGATASLVNLITKDKYSDIKYGIKLADRNI